MRARFRLLAALSALTALVLLQVEGLWASSVCSVEMDMPAASQVADASSHSTDCPMGESGHSHDQDSSGPEGPACPLMPAGATSCVGSAALLPSSSQPALGPVEDEPDLSSTDPAKDLLLAVSLLRPPRA